MPLSDGAVMSAMRREGGAGGPSLGSSGTTPPMTAPMSTPEPKQGAIQHAKVKIGQALDLIEMSLADLGSETPEGKAAIQAMSALHKIIGQKRAEVDALQPAENKSLLQNLPNAGGAQPGVNAVGGAPPVPGMSPPPGGSTAPTGGPAMPPAPPSPTGAM